MARRLGRNWIEAYLDYTIASEAPETFHLWTAIFTIAGALQRKCYIDQLYFQWCPNFYIVLVAPPGVAQKSTTINIGLSFLRQLDNARIGDESTNWQTIVNHLANNAQAVEEDGELWYHCSMSYGIGELGTFFRPHDTDLVDHLVSLWDAKKGTFGKGTKTQGRDDVVNPWLNIIGCTTPSWVMHNMPEYMLGGGFISRTVFVFANQKRQLVAYPGMVDLKQQGIDFHKLRDDLLHDLEEIGKMQGEFRLTREAAAFGKQWYEDLWRKTPSHLRDDRMQGYLARKQTHVHKLAIVLSAAESDSMEITESTLRKALAMADIVERDMKHVLAHVGSTNEGRVADYILRVVQEVKVIYRKDLMKMIYKEAPGRKADELIDGLVRAGLIGMHFSKKQGAVLFAPEVTEAEKPEDTPRSS